MINAAVCFDHTLTCRTSHLMLGHWLPADDDRGSAWPTKDFLTFLFHLRCATDIIKHSEETI